MRVGGNYTHIHTPPKLIGGESPLSFVLFLVPAGLSFLPLTLGDNKLSEPNCVTGVFDYLHKHRCGVGPGKLGDGLVRAVSLTMGMNSVLK